MKKNNTKPMWWWSPRKRHWWWKGSDGIRRYHGGELRRRRRRASVRGLPVRLSYLKSHGFHRLNMDPLPGFTHFSPPRDIFECQVNCGTQYHMSLAFDDLLDETPAAQAKRLKTGKAIPGLAESARDAIEMIKREFSQPRDVVLRVEDVDPNSSVGTLVDNDATWAPVIANIRFLREYYGKHGKPLIVSL